MEKIGMTSILIQTEAIIKPSLQCQRMRTSNKSIGHYLIRPVVNIFNVQLYILSNKVSVK